MQLAQDVVSVASLGVTDVEINKTTELVNCYIREMDEDGNTPQTSKHYVCTNKIRI